MGYDGRRDRHIRAMIADSTQKLDKKVITEEYESVTEELRGSYLAHFVPKSPVNREKSTLKIAKSLLDILRERLSTDAMQLLSGDSTT